MAEADFNEQLRPKHKWNEDAELLNYQTRALGGVMLVNVEDGSMKCWSPNPVPRIIYLQIVANNKRLGTQLCIDLMADAGMVLGEDGEPTDVR